MPYATYRFNKIIAAETIRFIVTVAIVVYKGLKLVVYRMLTVMALAAIKVLKKDGILCGAVILSIAGFATWSGVDYEWRGILMMVVFYLLGNVSNPSFPSGRKAQLFCAFPLMMHYGIVGALLACLVIACYDGTRGFIHGKVAKYGFYAFYPVHLMLFFLGAFV